MQYSQAAEHLPFLIALPIFMYLDAAAVVAAAVAVAQLTRPVRVAAVVAAVPDKV
ncbi:MAG: hypothetical protein AB7U34_04130 [Novosphingobium sp.]